MKNNTFTYQSGGIIGKTLLTIFILFLAFMLYAVIVAGDSDDSLLNEPTVTKRSSETKSSRCETPSEVLVETIASDLQTNGEGSLRNAHAVRSNDFEKVWFVAADIQAPGIEGAGDVGVWAVNAIDGTNANIIAADAIAREFTTWGTAGDFSERTFSSSNDGFMEARKCTGG